MSETLIALISIFAGMAGANLTGYHLKKYDFGVTGNTLAGVFGSIFLIKTIGRLGFTPVDIMHSGKADLVLLGFNLVISFLGGVIGVILAKKIKNYLNKPT